MNPAPDNASLPDNPTGTFASLRIPNFRLLFAGSALANAAQWIQQLTMSWLVYDITGSGAMLGAVNVARAAGTVGLSPVAGVVIDRVPRRTLMLSTAAWLFVLSMILSVILFAGERAVWYLFAFAFLGGVAQSIDLPLRQTVVFVLVPRAYAPNAVALIQTSWGLMRSLGPGVGGLLILWFGPGGNFLVQAAAYALIFLNTLRIAFPPHPPAPKRPKGSGSQMAEGLRFVRTHPTTRAFVLMSYVLPLFIIPVFSALPPIYAKEVFHGGPGVLGLLLSSVGVGAILGGLVAASLSQVDYRGRLQLLALFLLSLTLIAFAFTSDLVFALPLLACSGFLEIIYLTSNQTLLQLSIPDNLRGRVTSILSLNMGLSPLGALYAGAGADFLGPAIVTIVLCGIAAVIAVGVYFFSSTVRDYQISKAIAAGA